MKSFFDQSYGEDINLRNGKQYTYHYSDVTGHQFFNSPEFRKGSITIRGSRYDNVLLNYDIYNQQLVLQHTDLTGRTELLRLNEEFAEEFILDGKLFVRMTFPGTGTGFFQLIRSGKLTCLSYWEKNLIYSSTSKKNSYSFHKQFRSNYFLDNHRLRSIQSKSSFLTLFKQEYRREIKSYVRKEKIHFRKLSDEDLIKVLEFCNGLGADSYG